MQLIRLQSDKRTHEECRILSIYLQNKVQFFMNDDFTDKEFMQSLAEKMECEVFHKGDAIMRKGDKGDKMYFSIIGKLGIFFEQYPLYTNEPVTVLHPFKVVGERAIKNAVDRRSATVICLDNGETVCMSLMKDDY